jgi:class 3 adenylate cyclase
MRPASRAGGVSFLFCDVVGSTSILSALGEARSDELRRDLFDLLRRPLSPFLGEEVKSQGDGLMVAFRHSVADAVGCAIAMQQGVATLGGCDGWPPLEIRVGVSAGEVTAEDDDWFGTPVVEAARLCGLAGPQQILVTEHAVTDAITRRFGLRTVGPLDLKGFPEPVCCAEVPWSEADTAGLLAPLPPALLTAGHPDAVGLESSVALGLDSYDAAAAGFARGLIVSGPPRVGRTRFVAELVAAARNRGGGPVAVLYGCGARSDAPLGVIVEALRRFVLWAPLTVVGALADIDDLGVLVPALPLRLGRPPPPPDDRKPNVERLLQATLGAVDTIARSAPTILVLDDVEGCDHATLEFIGGLMTSVPEQRVLTIVTSRTAERDERPTYRAFLDKLVGDPAITEIELTSLCPGDHRRLVAATADPGAVGSTTTTDVADLVGEVCGTLAGDVVEAVWHLQARRPFVDESRVRAALSSAVPYKGLVALGGDDEDVFFGRRGLVDTLVRRLSDDRFAVVTGASGSGKSSALNAGVANEFRRLGIPVTVTSPSDADGIAAVTARTTPAGGGVVIDQFEEVFTLWDAEPRRQFLDRLLDIVDAGWNAWVAIALRSDFFGACAEHARLLKAMDDRTVLVGALSDDELHEIIEGPARQGSLTIEPVLTDLVIADLANEAHPLPLLSHALFETWRRRRGDRLTVVEYRAAGGLRRSIAHTADRIYTTMLDGEGQALARALLLRLIDVADDRPPTRRPLPIEHLHDAFGDRINPVLDRLVSARLLVAHDRFVDLAHEALITEWPRLAEWIDEDRDRLRTMVHLSHTATEWEAGDRSSTDLYRGVRLDAAFGLVDGGEPVTPSERAFVEASMVQREAEGRRLRRTNRRLRRQLIGAAVALVVAIAATTMAVAQQRRAERQRHDAELDLLNGSVMETADSDFALSGLLGAEARRLRPDGESLVAMQGSLRTQPSVLRSIYPAYITADTSVAGTSPDGRTVAVVDPRAVTFVDTTTLDANGTVEIADPLAGEFSPDGTEFAIATAEAITILDARNVTVVAEFPVAFPGGHPASDVTWSDDSHLWIASDGGIEPFQILDVDSGEITEGAWRSHAGPYLISADPGLGMVAAAPRTVVNASGNVEGATGSTKCCVQVLDGGTGALVRNGPTLDSGGAFRLLVADGQVLFGTLNNTITFDLDQPEELERLLSNGQASGLWMSADGSLTLSGNEAGHITMYDDIDEAVATTADLADLPLGRDLFFRGDNRAAFAVVDDHLVELSLTGREPLSTETFGEVGDIAQVVAANGDLVYFCPLRATGCRAVDPNTGVEVAEAPPDRGPMFFAADEKTLLWVNVAGDTLLLGASDEDPVATAPLGVDPDIGWWLAVDRDRTSLVVFQRDGAVVTRRSMVDFSELPVMDALEARPASAIAFSNDGELVARVTLRDDGSQLLDVVEIVSGRPVLEAFALPRSLGLVAAMTFDNENANLLFGHRRGGISELDLATADVTPSRFVETAGGVSWMWVSYDGSVLHAITDDGAMRWWDTASGTAFEPIRFPTSVIEPLFGANNAVWYSWSAEFAVVATEDGWRQWNLLADTWPDVACERAGRNLTLAEWERYLPPGEEYHVTCPQFPPGE